jgi:hypothetical protein
MKTQNLKAVPTPNVEAAPVETESTNDPLEAKVSISVTIPATLHHQIKIQALVGDTSVREMLEAWIEEGFPTGDLTISPMQALSMKSREKIDQSTPMKGLTVHVSTWHYNVIRFQALRLNTTLRALVKDLIQSNVKECRLEATSPVESSPISATA